LEQNRTAEGLRGCCQHEEPCFWREQAEAGGVTLLDSPGDRLAPEKVEAASERGLAPRPRQLEQGEWVAVALADDLVTDGGVERPVDIRQEERPSVALREARDSELGQPRENVIPNAEPRRTDDDYPLGQ